MKKVQLRVNGIRHEWIVQPKTALLDLLREDLRLTGAKQSCDRKGQCGACMVIVNNKAVRSCLARVADLDGAEVITVEGLGTPENPHLIQEAFGHGQGLRHRPLHRRLPGGGRPRTGGAAQPSAPCRDRRHRCIGGLDHAGGGGRDDGG